MTKEQIVLAALEKLDKECEEKFLILKHEQKLDEANFEKIKRNVYQIFMKMFRLSQKENAQKPFDHYLKTIPTNWEISLEEAKINGDFETEHIENIKLETRDMIKDIYHKVYL